MSSEENDLFPKIIVDPAAVGYAETDEELEEEEAIEIPSDDEKPDIPKVEKNVLRKTRKKRKFFRCLKRTRLCRKNLMSMQKNLSHAVRAKKSPKRS